jgi:multidrug efflux system membrane fusion protein
MTLSAGIRRVRLSLPRVCASALAVLALLAGCAERAPTPAPVRPAIVAHPRPAEESAGTSFSGDVRARHESQLGFRVGGKIARRHVDAAARVAAGAVLADLDPHDFELELGAARAAVAAAQADLALAQGEHDRFAALLERQLVSRSQFEAQETALAAARARLEQAQAQQAAAENQVRYAQLRADVDGIVTSITAEAGQVVAPGQVVAVLAQDGEREVEIALPEAGLRRYPVGMPAQVALWSAPERRLAAKVREVAPGADPASRTYRARVALLETDDTVQLGMTARVFFAAGAHDALAVPLTAMHALDDAPAVWVVDPASGAVALRPVQVLAWREDTVEIAGGIDAQDLVVVAGVHKLHPGQVVRPVDDQNRPFDVQH